MKRLPPQKPLGSLDSVPAVSPGDREFLLQTLQGVEDRLAHNIDQARVLTRAELSDIHERVDGHEMRILGVERAANEQKGLALEIRSLGTEVRTLMVGITTNASRDAEHERRLAELEKAALLEGKAAGAKSGKAWGAGAGAAAVIILNILNWIINQAGVK